MADDVKKETETPKPDLEAEAKAQAEKIEAEKKALDSELKAKEEKKANLEKAIQEAEEQLKSKRKARQELPSDEVELEIDMHDPGAKAWDKHITKKVQPLAENLEKERAEVRQFALKEFLQDKPALANNPEKVKELVDLYDRIKIASERNKEGVLLDLNKAFAAIYHEQLINAAKAGKIEKVKELELFSTPAIDKGATGYVDEKEKMPNLSKEDREILYKWGLTEEQWWDMKQSSK
jgi:hypothetical protein